MKRVSPSLEDMREVVNGTQRGCKLAEPIVPVTGRFFDSFMVRSGAAKVDVAEALNVPVDVIDTMTGTAELLPLEALPAGWLRLISFLAHVVAEQEREAQ